MEDFAHREPGQLQEDPAAICGYGGRAHLSEAGPHLCPIGLGALVAPLGNMIASWIPATAFRQRLGELDLKTVRPQPGGDRLKDRLSCVSNPAEATDALDEIFVLPPRDATRVELAFRGQRKAVKKVGEALREGKDRPCMTPSTSSKQARCKPPKVASPNRTWPAYGPQLAGKRIGSVGELGDLPVRQPDGGWRGLHVIQRMPRRTAAELVMGTRLQMNELVRRKPFPLVVGDQDGPLRTEADAIRRAQAASDDLGFARVHMHLIALPRSGAW